MKIKLTQALVNKYQIPPDLDDSQQELVDEGRTGLYLLVTKSGMKTFFLRYRLPHTKHVKLGRMVQRYVAINPDHLTVAIDMLPNGAADAQSRV